MNSIRYVREFGVDAVARDAKTVEQITNFLRSCDEAKETLPLCVDNTLVDANAAAGERLREGVALTAEGAAAQLRVAAMWLVNLGRKAAAAKALSEMSERLARGETTVADVDMLRRLRKSELRRDGDTGVADLAGRAMNYMDVGTIVETLDGPRKAGASRAALPA